MLVFVKGFSNMKRVRGAKREFFLGLAMFSQPRPLFSDIEHDKH